MAYTTISEVRARVDLGLSDETLYPDAFITALINKATYTINAYLGQSIELNTEFETAIVNAIPTAWGGLHIQLPRRFITEIEDSTVVVQQGYGIDDFDVTSTNYQLNKELGFIDTSIGSRPDRYFDMPLTTPNFQVSVSYKAGFASLPDDFKEALFAIMLRFKDSYDAGLTGGDVSASSNKIKEYKTLNEQVKYADNLLKDSSGAVVLENWVEGILNKYAMPKMGIGVRF